MGFHIPIFVVTYCVGEKKRLRSTGEKVIHNWLLMYTALNDISMEYDNKVGRTTAGG